MAFISEEAAKQIEDQIQAEVTTTGGPEGVGSKVSKSEAAPEGPFYPTGAEHAIASLSAMMQKLTEWWKTIRGDMYYYSSGHGFDQTHPKAREKLKQVIDRLDKFFDSETNLGRKGSIPVAVKHLEAIKKIK